VRGDQPVERGEDVDVVRGRARVRESQAEGYAGVELGRRQVSLGNSLPLPAADEGDRERKAIESGGRLSTS
jgi:hypothetical protein